MAKFTKATSKTYKNDKGNLHTATEWHNVVDWRSLAEEVGKYFKKGSSIYLEGQIKTKSYEDKVGVKKYVTEIIAENLIMLDKPESKPADKAEIGVSLGKKRETCGYSGNRRKFRRKD